MWSKKESIPFSETAVTCQSSQIYAISVFPQINLDMHCALFVTNLDLRGEKVGFTLAVRQKASLKEIFNLELLLSNRDMNDKQNPTAFLMQWIL